MAILIRKVESQSGDAEYVEVDRFPDHCPMCHAGIEPQYKNIAHLKKAERLELVFRCPRERCQSLFVARYHSSVYGGYVLYSTAPFELFDQTFSEHIRRVSPRYCRIANEAQKAEHQELKLIAGPGYRKALEFLIKDHLNLAQPGNAEAVNKMQLGPCINEFVQNDKVRAMAARAAWLGNDETHYVRKWEDKDLEDLKQLIALTVHWIEMEEMTASVLKAMPEGKK